MFFVIVFIFFTGGAGSKTFTSKAGPSRTSSHIASHNRAFFKKRRTASSGKTGSDKSGSDRSAAEKSASDKSATGKVVVEKSSGDSQDSTGGICGALD